MALLMENKAVSAEEKNPESKRRTLKITICSNSICVSSSVTYLIKVVLFSLSGKSLCQGQRLWGAVGNGAGRYRLICIFLFLLRIRFLHVLEYEYNVIRRACQLRSLSQALSTMASYQSSEGRRRCRLAENPTIKPTNKTPDPARNHLIY